jgi:hypothetical protein
MHVKIANTIHVPWFQDLPYELKEFLHCQYISESSIGSYYHLNFTANRNGVEDIDCSKDSMFFVEVKFMKGEQLELVVNCFCMVEHNDNGNLRSYLRWSNFQL